MKLNKILQHISDNDWFYVAGILCAYAWLLAWAHFTWHLL